MITLHAQLKTALYHHCYGLKFLKAPKGILHPCNLAVERNNAKCNKSKKCQLTWWPQDWNISPQCHFDVLSCCWKIKLDEPWNRPCLSYHFPLFYDESCAKPFIWDWFWFAWKWTCMGNTFSYKWFLGKTRFDTERQLKNGLFSSNSLLFFSSSKSCGQYRCLYTIMIWLEIARDVLY